MGRNNITILAVGDICLGNHYFTLGHGTASVAKEKGVDFIFNPIKDMLRNEDIVFGNLECPLSNESSCKEKLERQVFRGDTYFATVLRELGFNVLNIANNHIVQHGERAFFQTVNCLKQNGIAPVGLQSRGPYSCKPVVLNVNGLLIGFLGYSSIEEQYKADQKAYATGQVPDVLNDVNLLNKEVAIVIVSLHFGDEGVSLPSPAVIKTGRAIIDAGAKVILGHHSHVFQPVETYHGGVIFYSLGNFVFDLFWCRDLIRSAIVKIFYDKSENSVDYEIKPVGFKRNYHVAPLSPQEAMEFHDNLSKRLTEISSFDVDGERYSRTYREELKQAQRSMQKKKLRYFVKNFAKGNYRLKLLFAMHKLLRKCIFSAE